MQITNSVNNILRSIKVYLNPITSSAKFKQFFPLIVIVGTMTMVGSTYALFHAFALNGGRITVSSCISSPEGEPVHRQVWVRANPGTSVEATFYPKDTYLAYTQTSPAVSIGYGSEGRAYFRYFYDTDAEVNVFGLAGSKVYFSDNGVVAHCPNASQGISQVGNPQPNGGDNADGNGGGDYSTYYGSNPTSPGSAATKKNPEGTDCHSYTLQFDPNYSYPCVSHLQNDLDIGSDGVFGPGTLNSVRAFQANNGLTPDGVVGPATWCKIHDDLCSGGSQAPSATTPAAPDKQNPEGTDCHTYTLKLDPNYEYPCVRHLQNDLGIYADGIFGSNTQSAVKNFQSRHGLTPDGVVGPATWCKIHDDLCGGNAPAPTPAATIQGVQGRIFRDDNGNGSLDNGEKLIGNCGGGLDIDASVSANGETRNADDCNPGPFYRINTPAGGQTVSVNPPAGWSSTNGNTRNVTVQAGKYYDVGPWFGIRPTPSAPATTTQPTSLPTPIASTSGIVQIKGVGSGRCLDVPGQRFDKSDLQLYDCNRSKAQQWTFLSNGAIQINGGKEHGNKCIDVRGESTDNGTDVIIWGCHFGTNQQWYRPGDGTIRSTASGKCLDAEAPGFGDNPWGTNNGTRLQIYECNGGKNQLWQ